MLSGQGAHERKLAAERAGSGGDAEREVGFDRRARPCACAGWRKENAPGRGRDKPKAEIQAFSRKCQRRVKALSGE